MVGETLIPKPVLSPAAKERIQKGSIPSWVVPCAVPSDFKGEAGAQVTHLLVERQVHAERNETFYHIAMRLDSMQAVQTESPWRLDFQPSQEQITIHSIKTIRGAAEYDHADLSMARVVDRHGQGHAPQDRLTLQLMLEDVRPGDILEWAYTVKNEPLILPEFCSAMFTLPAGAPVGMVHFSVLFAPSRDMRWKTSVAQWSPKETQGPDETQWVWSRQNFHGAEPEENAPEWHIPYPWIQISDCPDWATVAEAFADAWDFNFGDPVVEKHSDDPARLIQTVQDEYRYLVTDWELDGAAPAAPDIVGRRRYGDGKDLAFFLADRLRRSGARATPVLVNTNLRKSLGQLLPWAGAFNHVLVECEIDGVIRWVDPAFKRQSGAARDFGAGLALGDPAAGLKTTPAGSIPPNVCELTETILLDTLGGWSMLGVVLCASGSHAVLLREQLERKGLEGLAKERLRHCIERFTKARRVGKLECRDDRDANHVFLAEVFEISGFLQPDSNNKWSKLDVPNDFILGFLKTPDPGARTAPFALPYPCHVSHTIELHSVALPPAVVQERTVETAQLRFARQRKTLAGFWTMQLTLSTRADAVKPEGLEKHGEALHDIREHCAWSILVPMGDARPHSRANFGTLPKSWNPFALVPESAPAKKATGGAGQNSPEAPPLVFVEKKPRGKRRKKRGRRSNPKARWPIFVACASGILLILLAFYAAKHADQWSIFQGSPAPPSTPVTAVQEQ